MIYSDEYRLIYFPIFKTGSRSMRELFIKLFDAKYYGDTHDRIVPDEMYEYTKITMVRNPYDRAISMWSHLKTARSHPYREVWDMEFEPFCEWLIKHPKVKTDVLLMNQTNYINGIKMDTIHKLEDIGNLLPVFNPAKMKSKHTAKTKKIIKEYAKEDFKNYEY